MSRADSMNSGREARRTLRGTGTPASRRAWRARNLFRAVRRALDDRVVGTPMSSSWRSSISPNDVIERPIRGMRTACSRRDVPWETASSVPATTRRTESVFTKVPSCPFASIVSRRTFVDQYVGFFEITPIFVESPRRPRAGRQPTRGRKGCRIRALSRGAVKPITAKALARRGGDPSSGGTDGNTEGGRARRTEGPPHRGAGARGGARGAGVGACEKFDRGGAAAP